MFNLFAAFVSYIFRIYIRIILLDTSVHVCFRVCVHIICIHLFCRWVIKGTDSSCSSWVEFPLPLGFTLYVFFRLPMFCDSHLCLSLHHLPYVKCEIIFSRTRKIYCSLTRFEKRLRNIFSCLRWYIASGTFNTLECDIRTVAYSGSLCAYILYIYIHTFIIL